MVVSSSTRALSTCTLCMGAMEHLQRSASVQRVTVDSMGYGSLWRRVTVVALREIGASNNVISAATHMLVVTVGLLTGAFDIRRQTIPLRSAPLTYLLFCCKNGF